MLPGYAELHCLTNYTFLSGASHPEEQVRQAARLGYAALAITDECSVAGVVRAFVEARAVGLRLIVGSEFRLDDGVKLVLLAESLNGYGNLCELITLARRRSRKGAYRLARADLERGIDECLALWIPGDAPEAGEAQWLAGAFPGRAWIAVELLRGPDDRFHLDRLRAIGSATGLRLVAAGDVHMHVRARRMLQNALTAIRIGKPVAQAGAALYPNGERYLRPIGRLARVYPPELLLETLEVAGRCRFSLDQVKYEYPEELVPAGETPASHLRRLTLSGAAHRYPAGVPERATRLVEHELALIAEMGYEPYFLTVHDIVRFARERGILCQGRGSAANSAVCYCLGITEVDPDRMQVLFERFISKERNEPPDIDVDFEHQRREEVMQYMFEKYGRDRAAITATVITYRPRSALRDAGKALGFSLDQVDKLAEAMSWWDGSRIKPEQLIEAGFDPENPAVHLLRQIVDELVGFPRHLSQHTGGFVLDNRRLSRLVPIENAAMPGRTVIQWDKDDLDALGLLKVDVLALGMLSCIRRTLDLVNGCDGRQLRMQDIPAEDPAIYDMLCRADSIGVFQVESRAQMAMLPRLRPRCYYDLVIEVAIVRPGPIQGGMVHPYLKRREGSERVTYPSPDVRQVLERTLGVSIFQEQVMQIAVVAAGFTAGEADRLRRAMAAWRRKGGLEPFQRRLIEGMLARGYSRDYAEQIYQMIRGFGEYGFPESHAASFALLVYVSAWLKCHEPAAFCAALLNSQPLGFYSPSQIVQDARRHGVEVRAVDVSASGWDCTLERGSDGKPAVRLGLRMVKGLTQEAGVRILSARGFGAFRDVADFFARTQLSRHDLNCIAEADALRTLAGHRRDALWAALGAETQKAPLQIVHRAEMQPELLTPTEGEDIVADYRRLGLTLRRHPLELLRPRLRRLRLSCAREVQAARHGQLVRAAGIVTCRQRPGTASGVTFVTLEDETGCINVVVWRDLAERQRGQLLGSSLLGVYGKIERKGEVIHLIAGKLVDYSRLLGGVVTTSRDCH
ncbi:MAG: error-prone DNA polymerase [Betaproteobacteria bacterium]|nr:error-prone DNA polymerase [Betaproteobacteria bacterium]